MYDPRRSCVRSGPEADDVIARDALVGVFDYGRAWSAGERLQQALAAGQGAPVAPAEGAGPDLESESEDEDTELHLLECECKRLRDIMSACARCQKLCSAK